MGMPDYELARIVHRSYTHPFSHRCRLRQDGGRVWRRRDALVAGEARRRDPVHDQGVLRDAQENARVVQGRAVGPRVRHGNGLRRRARRCVEVRRCACMLKYVLLIVLLKELPCHIVAQFVDMSRDVWI